MQKLARHIERLLTENDLVILPGFGALVAQRCGCRRDGDWLTPPSKQLSFNPSIRHNDGTLAASYLCEESCTFEQANLLADEALQRLTGLLDAGCPVHLEHIGIFRKETGRILFEPNEQGFPLPAAFGLKPVCFPALRQTSGQPEQASGHTTPQAPIVELGDRKRTLRPAIAIAATLALLFLPLQLNNTGWQMQTAGWTPQPTQIAPTDSTHQAESLLQEEEPEEEPATPYHLIIGSFKTQRQAVKMMQTVPNGWQPYLIYADDRYRIAINAFETQQESEEYLQRFVAAQPAYSDAWILTLNTEP